MDSHIVKPKFFGRLISYSVFGLLAIFFAYFAIWVVLQVSPLIGVIVVLVLIAGAYLGATQILGEMISDAGGLLGGDLFMNWIALRLTPDQVDSSWLLKLFFYVDRSRPLTGGEDDTL